MKQTILGEDIESFSAKMKKRKAIALLAAMATILLNILFCLLRTSTNHSFMMILNITVDILGGCFLVAFVSLYIIPLDKIVRLFSESFVIYQGVIVEISSETQRVMGMDCYYVTLNDGCERRLFLPDTKHIQLQVAETAQLKVASNMIVEVSK